MTMLSIYSQIPQTARPTYFHHMRFAVHNGLRQGVVRPDFLMAVAATSFGASATAASLLPAAGGVGFILTLVYSRFMNTRPKKPFFIVPGVISSVALLLMGLLFFGQNLMVFLALGVLTVMAAAMQLPAMTAIQRVNYPGTHRATIIGFIQSRTFVLTVVMSLLAGVVLRAHPHAYQWLLPVAGVLGLMSLWRVSRIRVRGERAQRTRASVARQVQRGSGSLLTVLRDTLFLHYEVNWWFFGFANLMLVTAVPLYMTNELGVEMDSVALALVVIPALLQMLTLPWWGRLLDRWNPITVVLVSSGIWALEPMLLYFSPSLVTLVGVQAIAVLYVARSLRGASEGGNGLVWRLGLMLFAPKHAVPTYTGFHLFLSGLRHVSAPLVTGWLIHQVGYERIFKLAMGLMLGSLFLKGLLLLRLKRHGRLHSFAAEEAREERRHGSVA